MSVPRTPTVMDARIETMAAAGNKPPGSRAAAALGDDEGEPDEREPDDVGEDDADDVVDVVDGAAGNVKL